MISMDHNVPSQNPFRKNNVNLEVFGPTQIRPPLGIAVYQARHERSEASSR
jgi:hypothetical protein